MPIDDQRHQQILDALIELLGEDYVFDDPAVVACYRREGQSPSYTTPMNPEFVVFPADTGQVQAIVRLANRLAFPYSFSCTGTLGAYAAATKPYWCWIDPKRMNALQIDAENMYAVVEPYVSHAEVGAEARKVGLYNANPSAGGQTSCLANHIALGTQTTAYRTGRASKNVLGVEMVLANGEILRTGTLAMGGHSYFWGEGPGPDLRGIIRSHAGHLGALGIVTRAAIKLFPWPGPARLETRGAAPAKECSLPGDTFQWKLVRYSTLADGIRAVRMVCKAELGRVLSLFAPWNISHHYSKSREEYWRLWNSGWFDRFGYCLVIGIWGIASNRQVQYESRVLDRIVEHTGGEYMETEIAEDWIRHVANRNVIDPLASRAQRIPIGVPPSPAGGIFYDSLTDAERLVPEEERLAAWVVPFDLGHFALLSVFPEPGAGDKSAECEEAMKKFGMQLFMKNKEKDMADANTLGAPINQSAPVFGSRIHHLVARLKRHLDPHNVANPGRFINMEAMEQAEEKPSTG